MPRSSRLAAALARLVLAASAALLVDLALLHDRAEAGTAVRLELPDLAARADLILEGRVVASRPLLDAAGWIATEYTLSVDRTWWGAPRTVEVVRWPGGELPDGRGLAISGMPALSVGEDVVLFLSRPGPSGARMPTGLAQGKFRIVTDPAGRRALVRDHGDLSLADPRSGAVRKADQIAVFEYAPFAAELEAALALRRARSGKGD